MPPPNWMRIWKIISAGLFVGSVTWLVLPVDLDEATAPKAPASQGRAQVGRPLELFDRPVEARPQTAQVVGAPPILQGVSVRGRRVRALVSFGGETAVWMRPGEVTAGWSFERYDSGAVILRSSDQELALRPFSVARRAEGEQIPDNP